MTRTRIITEEMFASIPALVAQGLKKGEIAQRFGCKASTLQVQCSRRGISLRKGGRRRPLALADAQLMLSKPALQALRQTALAMNTDAARLATDLLETIVKDGLYSAVLDLEAA